MAQNLVIYLKYQMLQEDLIMIIVAITRDFQYWYLKDTICRQTIMI